jgi:hypothetical protein
VHERGLLRHAMTLCSMIASTDRARCGRCSRGTVASPGSNAS